MFEYEPDATLAAVTSPVTALLASDDETGSRGRALEAATAARVAAGRSPIAWLAFPGLGHNLMRYRPVETARAILAADAPATAGARPR
jgi:pimeloyl-ACP methyl ester carboxylesterase